MSNRKIINAASTGGIGYYPVGGASDPYYDNVVLLLNGDSVSSYNGYDPNWTDTSLLLTGDNFTDLSNNRTSITATTVPISKTDPKYTTGSMFFDTTLSTRKVFSAAGAVAAAGFGTGPYTIELWVKFVGTASGNETFFELGGDNATSRLIVGRTSTSKLRLWSDQAGDVDTSTWTSLPVGSWFHFALVRSGATTAYLNGVALGSTTPATARNYSSASSVSIGRNWDNAEPMSGYLSQIRFTKMARYTSTFTPPTGALPSHRILDSSVYQLPVTTYGNARIDTTTKKYGTGSMYFDGTGDYLTLLPNINLAFPADFTIELWFNSSSFAAQRTLMSTAGYYVAGNNGNWTFRVTSASSIAFAQYNSQSSGGGGWEFTVPVMSTGTWYHVAVARSNGTISLYLNGTASSTTYSNSSNISDGSVSNVYVGRNVSYDNDWMGYIDDLRITKGYARYTANFTPPTASLPTIPPTIPADPWWGNVSLLLDGNTTDAYDPYWQNVSLMLTGDDFIDWSNQHNAITVVGNTAINTTTKKFGTGSMYFDGSGDYLNLTYDKTKFDWWTSDFTLECWVNPTTLASFDFYSATYNVHVSNLIGNASASSAYANWLFGPIGDGRIAFYYYNGSVVTPTLSTATVSAGTWSHIALTKTSAGFQIWVNGVGNGYVTISGTPQAGTDAAFIIGNCQGTSINGYVDDLRITKGVARYTANFTPPTAALPAYKIQDRTQNNLTLTPYGNVQLSTDVMRYGTGSMYFDGTGDYLTLPTSSAFGYGAEDFTVELWMYCVSNPGGDAGIVEHRPAGTNGAYLLIGLNSSRQLFVYVNSAVKIGNNSSSLIGLSTWVHVAYTRTSSTGTLYINGVSVGTWADTTSYVSACAGYIGHHTFNAADFNGYIDDLRITKGVARYTQNFTPPSQSFATQYISTGYDANYADVSLLLNGNGTNGSQVFTDLSSTPKTITAYGNAQISTAVKKYGVGSMYFDGGNTRLNVTTHANLNLTDDFTIEFWMYPLAAVSAYPVVITTGDGSISLETSIIYNYPNSGINFSVADGKSITGSAPSENNWHHIVVSRQGTTTRMFIDGVKVGTDITAAYTFTQSKNWYIGDRQANAGGANYPFKGYIDDLRITKGIARYTTNFTPPTYQLPTDTTGTVIDPLRSSTSLLLRGNGTNGSTGFTDESPNGLTVTNNGPVAATINTTTKKYGTGSILFAGTSTSNYSKLVVTDTGFGTADFTLEMWVNFSSSAVDQYIFDSRSAYNDTTGIALLYNDPGLSGKIGVFYGTGWLISTSVSTTTNAWTHVALCRIGTTFNIFINGVSGGTATLSANLSNTIYRFGSGNDNYPLVSGYLDDIRITKGYARYTSNFTPPTYEDPIVTGTVYDYNYPQVSLLLNGDGTNGSTVFTDLSSSPKTITAYGNAQIRTTVKKFGTGSMYFDGSGDYLGISSNSAFNLSGGPFTIECWIYPTGVNSFYRTLIANRLSGTNTCSWEIFLNTGNGVLSYFNGTIYSSTVTPANNVWSHVAAVYNGTNITLFLNGVSVYTAAVSNVDVGGDVTIGSFPSFSEHYDGYIDDLRVTKGLARYTQNFTPPTAPLPTSYS